MQSVPSANPNLLDEAVDWMLRTRDPAFRDWAGFTAWLEADAAHNTAYEAALDADDIAGDLTLAPPVVVAEPVREPERSRRWPLRLAGGATALAAGIAAAVVLLPSNDRYDVATAPGAQRVVRLADGTTVTLNGGTRMTFDRNDTRVAVLDSGEASFAVVHDAAHPFEVVSGGNRIRDVGTVFNVVRGGGVTEVAVAEGAVLYDPGRTNVRLTAGRTLRDPDTGVSEIGDADPATIGAWRHGRLVYRAAPLGRVAADLSRMMGEKVTVSDGIARRDFSGMIMVRGVERRVVFARLAAIMDLGVEHDAGGWRLVPGDSGSR